MTKRLGWLALAAMSVALTLTLALSTHVTSVSAQRGDLPIHIEKNCSSYTGAAGSYCTIFSSNVPQIPPGSTVFYDQAFCIPDPVSPDPTCVYGMLDSNIVVYTGPLKNVNGALNWPNWAVGRCTLSPGGTQGLCTLSDGHGTLAGIQARVDVAQVGPPSANNYSWTGKYGFPSSE
jgi:hypothetical protein